MTDFSSLISADKGQQARGIHLVDAAGHDNWLKGQSPRARRKGPRITGLGSGAGESDCAVEMSDLESRSGRLNPPGLEPIQGVRRTSPKSVSVPGEGSHGTAALPR